MKSLIETDAHFICEINAPSFKLLNPQQIELIRSSKTQVIFHKGENLTKQGTFSSYILFIINGIVKKHVEETNDRYINISIHTENEMIGLSSLFQQKKFAYSTIALKETQAYLIEASSLQVIIKENAAFAYEIIQQYCKENAHIFKVLQQQSFKQMYARLASTLLYLNQFSKYNIFSLLTRKEIAAFAGLSTESTIKLLKEFEQERILSLNEKNIELVNLDKLNKYSQM
ncbi:MAG TPA: Crp/Fnr family transcriptional regulator [Bacteroidales bacterium]|jgi:CRP/FNR family transcriptional regulator|nr:Crp/Fnr family transcriptional regulator [Bacteroidales bacterium]HNV95162.1 Crp/Fnr family transcriptional regulator [Bacteroidales bacterium]